MNKLNTTLLQNLHTCDNIDSVIVKASDIKRLHDIAIAQAQLCRELLGWPPLLTGKQQRKMAAGQR